MFDGDPKKPHPLTQSFGSDGEKLVPSFCSEPIIENFPILKSKSYCKRKKNTNLESKKQMKNEFVTIGLGFVFMISLRK